MLCLIGFTSSAAAFEISDRFRFDLHLSAGIMVGKQVRFVPLRAGTEPLVAEATLGIPEDGVAADQWAVAARVTYRLRGRDAIVLQLSHRRFSESTLTDAEDVVDLDWLYYEHFLGKSTSIRLGRTPVAFGLLNEIRDEGTKLTFFRVPFSFYDEGGFISETVDGARFRHTFGKDDGWGLTFEAYGGRWELLEMAGAVNRLAGTVEGVATDVEKVDVTGGYGGALWVNLPFGRIGGGGQRFSSEGGIASHLPGEKTSDWENDFVSVQLDVIDFQFRGEYREARFPVDFSTAAIGLPIPGQPNAGMLTEAETAGWYVQAGFRFLQKWGVFARIEGSGEFFQCYVRKDLRCERLSADQVRGLNKPHGERTWGDTGLVVRYERREGLVFRGEIHDTDGMALRRDIIPLSFSLTRETSEEHGYYALLSVSWHL